MARGERGGGARPGRAPKTAPDLRTSTKVPPRGFTRVSNRGGSFLARNTTIGVSKSG